jgi:hypothetical protein
MAVVAEKEARELLTSGGGFRTSISIHEAVPVPGATSSERGALVSYGYSFEESRRRFPLERVSWAHEEVLSK